MQNDERDSQVGCGRSVVDEAKEKKADGMKKQPLGEWAILKSNWSL